MFIEENYVIEKDDGTRFGNGDSGVYEPYTDNIRRLFDGFQREYGPCRGSVYIDNADHTKIRRVGWLFRKRVRYTDYSGSCEHETWVTLYDDKEGHTYKTL